MRWHRLSGTVSDGVTLDLEAASCCDGIPVLARWVRKEDGTYAVLALDGETQSWETVSDSDEECVPRTPPTIWSDELEREIRETHAVFDHSDCQIIRLQREGYPPDRLPMPLKLSERAEALLQMKRDYCRWLENQESLNADLLRALEAMLASAHPHPDEHPGMFSAWKIGRAALAKAKGNTP